LSEAFDFDTPIDRKQSDAIKWRKYDGRDIIPLWVADMDFRSPPAVIEALHRRVDHGVFGYAMPDRSLAEIIVAHLFKTYGWRIAPEWVVWLPGLVSGIHVACRTIGSPGSGVLTTVPIYPPFLKAPRLSGKKLATSSMIFVDDTWRIDLDDLKKTRDSKTALLLLCNPHNPTGRMLTRAELEAVADICLSRRWAICSDEIHCDLIMDASRSHIPIASLDAGVAEHTITLMAPSKTYNIPGLSCSLAVIPNLRLRRRFIRTMTGIVPHVNLLGFVAAQAAYTSGQPWLEAVLAYLRENLRMVCDAVKAMQGLHMAPVEATYLAWIDARALGVTNPSAFFEDAGVGLSDGADFGVPGFVRLNFACARSLLAQALARMARAIDQG
jgi:cystathionine beta-lyase